MTDATATRLGGAGAALVLTVVVWLAWPETAYEPRWVAIEMARAVEEGR